MKVFFFEAFEEEEVALKRFLPNNIEAGFTWKTIQEFGQENLPAPIISVRTQSQIPTNWANDLEAIITRSTGYDHILQYRKDAGVHVPAGYLPLYCNRAVAEQAMLMWMTLLRKLPQQMENFHTFHRDGLTGRETMNKTLLVVGVGNIGSEVVKIGHGLGMHVLCCDPVQKLESETYLSLEEGLPQADIVVCAMNLTEDNRGLFNEENLHLTKKGVILINISRGEQSPSSVLLKLIEENHLGGVGLDVYNNEKALAISLREKVAAQDQEVLATLALSQHENVILTPHNAFNTLEAVDNKSEQSIQQLACFLENGKFIWEVG